jgi:gliding motility-associated-like protein
MDVKANRLVLLVNVGNPIAAFEVDPLEGDAPFTPDIINNSINYTNNVWDFGNGEQSNELFPSYTYEDWGEFTITLTITDEYGCEDEMSVTVTVKGESSIIVPNVFSPNGDGINDVFRVISENILTLEGFIYNRWGQLINKWEGPNGVWAGKTAAGEDVSEGVYFYVIKAKGADDVEYDLKGSVSLVR